MNHLEGISKIIKDGPSIKLIDNVRKILVSVRLKKEFKI